MCVKLGYIIPSDLQVDHIDDDKTNDNVSNLQLLTQTENQQKEKYRYLAEDQIHYAFYCYTCKNYFTLTEKERNKRMKSCVEKAFCSRECSFQGRESSKQLSENDIEKIRRMRRVENKSGYEIRKLTGFSFATIKKYW